MDEARPPASEAMDLAPDRASDLTADLLAWYDAHRRAMPWRAAPGEAADAYHVWVSEMMLQQTRVDTVLRYFDRWMERFPTIAALAAADEQEVLAAWSGLGYYRRARALHQAARDVVFVHGGHLPTDPDDLRTLPGIGPYAAGAIASIAFGAAVPAVDGNVVRVLARLDGERRPVQGAVRKALEARAAALVPADRPGDWNQALMDLGATVCTPRAPRCDACPLAKPCVARAADAQADIPAPVARRAPREETMQFAVVEDDGRVLFVREPGDGLLGGLWRLPGGPADGVLEDQVASQTGIHVHLAGPPGTAVHRFTHRTWTMQVRAGLPDGRGGADRRGVADGRGEPAAEVAWIHWDALEKWAISTAMHRALAAAPGPRRVPSTVAKPQPTGANP